MASSPSPTTSATASPTASSSPAVDVSAYRSCHRCDKRMSSVIYDNYTLCLPCRNVTYSVEFRCSECSEWSVDLIKILPKAQEIFSLQREKECGCCRS